MYANASKRTKAAVPVFLANGRPDRIEKYGNFQGIDPGDMYPQGLPCSQEWHIHEASRWIGEHLARAGEPPGPVRAAWGFRMIELDSRGSIRESLKVIAEGTATALE